MRLRKIVSPEVTRHIGIGALKAGLDQAVLNDTGPPRAVQ